MKTPAPASASIKPLHLMAWEALTQRIEQHRLALTQNNSVFKNLTHPVMLRLSEEISSTQLTATYRFFSKLLRSTQYHEKLFRDGQRRSITFPRGTSITAQSKVFKPGKAPAGQNFIALPYQCSLIYEMQCNPDTKEVKARACLLLNVGDKNYRIDTLEHPTIKDFKNRPTKSPDSASCFQKEQQLSQNKNLFGYPKIFPFPPKPGDIAAKQQNAVAIAIEEAKENSSAQEVKSLEQNEGTAGNCREREEDKMVENAWRLWGEEAPQKIMNIIKANVPSASDNPRNPRRFFTENFLRSDVTALAYQAVQQAKSVDDFFQRLKNGFTTELIKTETVPHPSSPYTPPLRFR